MIYQCYKKEWSGSSDEFMFEFVGTESDVRECLKWILHSHDFHSVLADPNTDSLDDAVYMEKKGGAF